jgi:hypothetical protein
MNSAATGTAATVTAASGGNGGSDMLELDRRRDGRLRAAVFLGKVPELAIGAKDIARQLARTRLLALVDWCTSTRRAFIRPIMMPALA